MAFRNLIVEFKGDARMSPVNPKRASLVDDWKFTLSLSPSSNQAQSLLRRLNIAQELSSLWFTITPDITYGSGRILRVTQPNIKGQPSVELLRGLSLGEIYDFLSLNDQCELFEIAFNHFTCHFPSQAEYDAEQNLANKLREQAIQDSIEDHLRQMKGGHWRVVMKPQQTGTTRLYRDVPTLQWISAARHELELHEAEESATRRELKDDLRFCRQKIRELLDPEHCTHKFDAPEYDMDDMITCLSEVFDIAIITEAIRLEVELMENRIQRAKKVLEKKNRGTIKVAPISTRSNKKGN